MWHCPVSCGGQVWIWDLLPFLRLQWLLSRLPRFGSVRAVFCLGTSSAGSLYCPALAQHSSERVCHSCQCWEAQGHSVVTGCLPEKCPQLLVSLSPLKFCVLSHKKLHNHWKYICIQQRLGNTQEDPNEVLLIYAQLLSPRIAAFQCARWFNPDRQPEKYHQDISWFRVLMLANDQFLSYRNPQEMKENGHRKLTTVHKKSEIKRCTSTSAMSLWGLLLPSQKSNGAGEGSRKYVLLSRNKKIFIISEGAEVFSLEKRRALITSCNYPKGGCSQVEVDLFSRIISGRVRGKGQAVLGKV